MKRVLVSLSANSVASREFLTGVLNYVNAGHDWRINFQQNPNDLTPRLLKSFVRDGLDGIVTGINKATPGYRTMISLGIPLALNNFPATLSSVHPNHVELARRAAEELDRLMHGRSMRDEILDTRTHAAERLLRETKESLVYIAHETGFASACHLSHHFKKRHGMSPEAWRKEKQNGNF